MKSSTNTKIATLVLNELERESGSFPRVKQLVRDSLTHEEIVYLSYVVANALDNDELKIVLKRN